MPLALYALAAGAFGIGVTEFVIMGLLIDVGKDLGVSIPAAGLLISGYAFGVVLGAPLLGIATAGLPKKPLLLALMVVFTLGNAACALAPDYWILMAARVVTAFAHATFFGVGSVVATSLVAADKKATAIAIMFTGLTAANILGVPFGTWLGQHYGWRSTFWAVTLIGIVALAVIQFAVPRRLPSDDTETKDGSGLSVLVRPAVLIGLAVTVLSWIGVFGAFTYIAPLLTQVAGFPEAAVSPILLIFGGGLLVGNLLGGKLADKRLTATVIGTLAVLALTLVAMGAAIHQQIAALIFVGLLGAVGFATVAPLQLWVLGKAGDGGQSLVSSFNIAAFNLGNALGAWLLGLVIDHGPGLAAVPLFAALSPVLALVIATIAIRREQRQALVPVEAATARC